MYTYCIQLRISPAYGLAHHQQHNVSSVCVYTNVNIDLICLEKSKKKRTKQNIENM